jgi:hypothetical protein
LTLSDLEALAIERASILDETRRGYAFAEAAQGRLRIMHDRSAESGRGITRHFLNGLKIDRQRAASLLA